jgi:hypothetical protein
MRGDLSAVKTFVASPTTAVVKIVLTVNGGLTKDI